MSENITPQEAASAARRLLDERVTVVETLAQSAAHLKETRTAFSDAEKEYARDWAAAEKAGWSVTELRRVGLPEPGRKRPGRPRKTPAPKPSTSPEPPAPTSE
ncbi:hypothetical protein [Janibacter corallicola]|uniref:hypothetical protein n=1 Tax=Janibacter corallicola TaxID=415212 RepID=UPI000AC6A87D|nr:hypothetical protein [Janibacter corallicola]